MTDAIESTLQEKLYKIEAGFWLQGKEHFLEHVDERCLLAFPQAGETHGIRSREEVAGTASTQPGRWCDLKISNPQALQLSSDVVMISYRADVARFDGEPYAALVGSGYVRRESGWRLAFRQHSPV